VLVRERAGRHLGPSLVVLDSQSVRAAAGVPKSTTGLGAAEKTPGRRRGLAVDVIGLIVAVVVVAASVHDSAIGTTLLEQCLEPVDRLGEGVPSRVIDSKVTEYADAPTSAGRARPCLP
jgi:hypothetical protein